MLKLILQVGIKPTYSLIYLNTSHVKVNPVVPNSKSLLTANLNTSHVKVNLRNFTTSIYFQFI